MSEQLKAALHSLKEASITVCLELAKRRGDVPEDPDEVKQAHAIRRSVERLIEKLKE